MPSPHTPPLRKALLSVATAGILLLTGCATVKPTHLVDTTAAARLKQVVVAPPDVEMSALSAGGVAELHDDWTEDATNYLTTSFSTQTGWQRFDSLSYAQQSALAEELDDVQALLRAITLNHLLQKVPGPNQIPHKTARELNYHTGPLTRHTELLGTDAMLFIFIRNSYATAGRKTLAVFGVLAAGFTGVAVIPAMGRDLASAALVSADGTVVWFNQIAGGADPRNPEGANALVKQLLTGLPLKEASPADTSQ